MAPGHAPVCSSAQLGLGVEPLSSVPLWGHLGGASLLLGVPVEVSSVGVDRAAVVCTVDRAVVCVAMLTDAVGCVAACVRVGPVAVDLGVAVGAGPDVACVVTAKVVGGDSAGNRPEHPLRTSCPYPLPQEPAGCTRRP